MKPVLPTRFMIGSNELMLRRKWTFRAHGRQVVFIKKADEHVSHVLMKAFIWAMYLPAYPNLMIEMAVGGKFKPDLVQADASGYPVFWAEAGRVSQRKIRALIRRYRATHFVFAKWDVTTKPLEETIIRAVGKQKRTTGIELITFPPDSAEHFIDQSGVIRIDRSRLTICQL